MYRLEMISHNNLLVFDTCWGFQPYMVPRISVNCWFCIPGLTLGQNMSEHMFGHLPLLRLLGVWHLKNWTKQTVPFVAEADSIRMCWDRSRARLTRPGSRKNRETMYVCIYIYIHMLCMHFLGGGLLHFLSKSWDNKKPEQKPLTNHPSNIQVAECLKACASIKPCSSSSCLNCRRNQRNPTGENTHFLFGDAGTSWRIFSEHHAVLLCGSSPRISTKTTKRGCQAFRVGTMWSNFKKTTPGDNLVG